MRRAVTGLLAIAFFSIARVALADDFGHLSQLEGDPPNNVAGDFAGAQITPDANGNPRAPVACAPTATVNSFIMLQNRYGITGLVNMTDQEDEYDAISALADDMQTTGDEYYNPESPGYHATNEDGDEIHTGGTGPVTGVDGKVEYIAAHQTGGPEIETHGESVFGNFNEDGSYNIDDNSDANIKPTDDFLQEQLEMGQDIELWIQWWDPTANMGAGAYVGGHVVTLTDMDSDEGTIDFIDPWGPDGTAVSVDGTFTTHNGYLQLHYPSPDDGGDDPENPDNPDDVMQADIFQAVAESPVPEPTSISLLTLFGASMLCRRTREKAV